MFQINGERVTFRITWECMRKCKAAEYDLSQVETLLGDWFRGDPGLVEVGWIVYQCQPDLTKIERAEFEAAATGQGCEDLRAELVRALCDFFPPPRAALVVAAADQVSGEIRDLIGSMNRPTDSPAS